MTELRVYTYYKLQLLVLLLAARVKDSVMVPMSATENASGSARTTL